MRESVASAGAAPPGLKIYSLARHGSEALCPYFSLDDVLRDFWSFWVGMVRPVTKHLGEKCVGGHFLATVNHV
jgi:hypothetical protein